MTQSSAPIALPPRAEAAPAILAIVDTYPQLAEALARRRFELGMSQLDTDAIAGLSDGYTGKIECGMKHLGGMSMPALLGALGLKLALIRTTPHAEKQKREVFPVYRPRERNVGAQRIERCRRTIKAPSQA